MHLPTAARRALGAEPTDPTLLSRTRTHGGVHGGTHRYARLMSAESELGTLPVSAFWLRSLHIRGGLGRSAVLRRTRSNDVPLQHPCPVPAPAAWPWPLTLARYEGYPLSPCSVPKGPL